VAVCPVDAIHHSEFPVGACPTLESLPSYETLVMALRERRSHRVFQDQPVPRETVRQLVDVSRWGPSASNAQEVEWIAIDDPERVARLSAEVVASFVRLVRLLPVRLLHPLLAFLLGSERAEEAREAAEGALRLGQAHARGEDPILYHAPVVLVAHVPRRTAFGRDDAVYAAYNLMLAAQRLGLGTCHIGYVNIALRLNRGLRRMLGLPQGRQLEVALVLGYPRFRFQRAVPRRPRDLIWNPA
jgi:nitroreductase